MLPLMKNAFINEYETKKDLADFLLRTSKLSMGEQCENFQQEFSLYQGRWRSVLFNSGGSANIALLQALKNLGRLKDGDHVGFSALTWSTNVMPIIQMGFTPVPIDCNLSNLNVCSDNLLSTLSLQPLKALFITNVLGFVGDIQEISNICRDRDIILIEDNCESLGTICSGTKSGNFGVASTFSFFVAHHMSTIEGGMVCTDDLELEQMLCMTRANGWDRNLSPVAQKSLRDTHGIRSEFDAKYTFYDLGFNFRPTEITGFLGRKQLQYLEKNIETRLNNYNSIVSVLSKNSDFRPLESSHIDRLSTFAMPFICDSHELRNRYLERFSGAGIEIRPMIAGNITRQPFYKKYCSVETLPPLPNTDFLDSCGFYCGNYPELTRSDIDLIKSCVL